MTTAVSLDNPGMIAPPRTLRVTEPLPLEYGRVQLGHTVSFETYGTLTAARDNAILVCHSLTKGAHAAGRHAPGDPRPGWWDAAIGPGRLLDTDRYFVICAEPSRRAGPPARPARTGHRQTLRAALPGGDRAGHGARPAAADHQARDRAPARGYRRLLRRPAGDRMGDPAPRPGRQRGGHHHHVGHLGAFHRDLHGDAPADPRRPSWNGGDYYGESFPASGRGAAIAAAVPLWVRAEAMDARFARRPGERGYTLDAEFEVESFIARLAAQASQSSHELTRTGDRPCNAGSGRRRLLSALSFVTPCDWANDMG